MHAVVIHETGGPEVMRWEEFDDPEPGDGEVLVQVNAASVNPVDWKNRRERAADDLPMVLGRDFSGTVEASNADGFTAGDEVFGFATSGSYAELTTASAHAIAKKPEGVSHEEAAAIPVAGLTAWQGLLDKGGLASGQTALVAGAAGGVGHFAVQFAHHAGARTIATGSGRNRDFVAGLGADEYVDYTEQDVADAVSDVDVALDTVGGDVTGSLLPTVREGGILVVIAAAPPEEEAKALGIRTELHVTGPDRHELAQVARLIADGQVRVEIAEVVPIAEVQRAHQRSEAGHVRGKLILVVAG
jgi:NADPH:quinone reductase-like Zn-dependent oxidoreductase